MKKSLCFNRLLVQVSLVFVMLILSNCAASKSTPGSNYTRKNANYVQPNENESTTATWSSLLRQVPGVNVSGSDEDLTLEIRGPRSLQGVNRPLLVLDGVPLGNDFGRLSSAILPKDVGSIRVLKGGAAAIYGVRGANGVVVVKTKE